MNTQNCYVKFLNLEYCYAKLTMKEKSATFEFISKPTKERLFRVQDVDIEVMLNFDYDLYVVKENAADGEMVTLGFLPGKDYMSDNVMVRRPAASDGFDAELGNIYFDCEDELNAGRKTTVTLSPFCLDDIRCAFSYGSKNGKRPNFCYVNFNNRKINE